MDKNNIPPVGTKIEMKVIGYFGNEVNVAGEITKPPYQHGYNSSSGAWVLSNTPNGEFQYTPCYKFGFRPKRKRATHIIECGDVIEIVVK